MFEADILWKEASRACAAAVVRGAFTELRAGGDELRDEGSEPGGDELSCGGARRDADMV